MFTKIDSLKTQNLTPEQFAGIKMLFKETLVFIGAVLTGFRNRAAHYTFALRKLVPQNALKAAKDAAGTEDVSEPQSQTGNKEGQEPEPNV